MKILSIVGARPQFIKHAALSRELDKHFEHLTLHTGQHYDEEMSDLFFKELSLKKPDFILNGLESISGHGAQTAFMLSQIEAVLIVQLPDFVLVYGDTNSTLAGSLAASKLSIKIIHVEAGLRSYNMTMPEEINRIITDRISSLMFVPNKNAKVNLLQEGLSENSIYEIGDVMKDASMLVAPLLKREFNEKFYLATIHRPYNTDQKSRIISLLNRLNGLKHKVVFPIHPRTLTRLKKDNVDLLGFTNIKFCKPKGYISFMSAIKYSEGIITDSGGVQKEAYFLKKKCVTIRTETEWVETLIGGWNHLVFDNLEKLQDLLDIKPSQSTYNQDLYGNGKSSKQIAETLKNLTL